MIGVSRGEGRKLTFTLGWSCILPERYIDKLTVRERTLKLPIERRPHCFTAVTLFREQNLPTTNIQLAKYSNHRYATVGFSTQSDKVK